MVNPLVWLVLAIAAGVALFLLGIAAGRRLEEGRAEERALEALEAEVTARQAVYAPVTAWTYQAAHAASQGRELERQEQIAAEWHQRAAEGRGVLELGPAGELEPAPADVAGGQDDRPPPSPEDLDLAVRHMIEQSQLDIAALIARHRHAESENPDA